MPERSGAELGNLTPTHETTGGVYIPVRIIDMGAQLVDVIQSELAEVGFASEIIPFTQKNTKLDVEYLKANTGTFIFTGSGMSVHDKDAPHIPEELLDGKVPALLFCYSAQDATHVLGGRVGKAEHDGEHLGEYGQTSIEVEPEAVIYGGLSRTRVLMSHGDSILEIPEGFRVTGKTDHVIASFESADGRVVATQFHPEVADTDDGTGMILRFLTETAGIEPDPDYTMEAALETYIEKEELKIKEVLERGDFIAGFLSGGVDSMVAASAVMNVAGELNRLDQVRFYYVDTGHTRVEDDEIVSQMQAQGMPVEKIDAAYDFFHRRVIVYPDDKDPYLAPALVDADDPEEKRLIMGTNFTVLSDEIIERLQAETGRKVKLMQGTNNSDLVESAGRGGKKIKGHHNVEAMANKRAAGELIEPLAGLMKYHVRALGENRYNLPHEFATRPPFPGPGTSPRIVVNRSGELPPMDELLQRRLDGFVQEETGGLVNAHLVPLKTVGVKGDDRSLADVVFLDGEPEWGVLEKVSKSITDKFSKVNRVLYVPSVEIDRQDIRGAVTIDNEYFAAELKRMEEVFRKAMASTGLDPYISQHFVATLGVDLVGAHLPTLAARMFITGKDYDQMVIRRTSASKETFRTGVAALPSKQIDLAGFNEVMSTLMREITTHGAVVYDLTGKPPGTTEFE